VAQETRAIFKYQLREGDSLERLALTYMKDAEQWLQLAILNGLDYPYISDDPTLARRVQATGSVTFTRTAGSTGNVVIPSGFKVYVPASSHAPRRDYQTTAGATILTGNSSVSTAIQALLAGDLGNTPPLTVTGIDTPLSNLASVANTASITGGEIKNVKFPGETVLVFAATDSLSDAVGLDTLALSADDFFAALYGADIALTADGDLFADSRGGLAVVKGVRNLTAALQRRLVTPLDWYYYHRGYGSGVERAVGQRADSYWLQFARLEAERTVRSDPRVQSVQNIRATFTTGVLRISMDILTIGEKDPLNIVFTARVPGG
jgi:hypothetical protein